MAVVVICLLGLGLRLSGSEWGCCRYKLKEGGLFSRGTKDGFYDISVLIDSTARC